MDFMEFINTPVGAISMLMLGVLIICIWAVIHFSYLYKKEKSAVVKWFNATHAVLTFINDKNIKIYGGVIPNRAWRKAERNTLKEYWDISDVNSLNESIKFLMQYGHRSEYINKGNEGDIGAWDYSRAMSLLSSAFEEVSVLVSDEPEEQAISEHPISAAIVMANNLFFIFPP